MELAIFDNALRSVLSTDALGSGIRQTSAEIVCKFRLLSCEINAPDAQESRNQPASPPLDEKLR